MENKVLTEVTENEMRVIETIGDGRKRLSDVQKETGMSKSQLQAIFKNLRDLRILTSDRMKFYSVNPLCEFKQSGTRKLLRTSTRDMLIYLASNPLEATYKRREVSDFIDMTCYVRSISKEEFEAEVMRMHSHKTFIEVKKGVLVRNESYGHV